MYFNPRSPRGERLFISTSDFSSIEISIHAPREGSDFMGVKIHMELCLFQSTLPARGATIPLRSASMSAFISIHAPREGSDCIPCCFAKYQQFQSTLPARGATDDYQTLLHVEHHFNPRSPRGERPFALAWATDFGDFNPRSPRGERQDRSCSC